MFPAAQGPCKNNEFSRESSQELVDHTHSSEESKKKKQKLTRTAFP